MAKKKQPRRQKHVPQRTCVICREKTDKRSLTRVVRTTEDGVHIDPTGKQNGRGAYICTKPTCWNKAHQSTILENALKTTLTDDDKARIQAAAIEITEHTEGNDNLHE